MALGLLLLGSALAFGGATPAVAPWLASLALGAAAVGLATSDRSLPQIACLASASLFAMATLGMFQGAVSEATLEANRSSSEPQQEPSAAPQLDPLWRWLPRSVAPGATFSAAWDWAGSGAVLLLAALSGTSRRSRRYLLVAILSGAAVQVGISMAVMLSGSPYLWGRELPPFGLRLRGSFVNPNHCALWLGISWCVSLAVLAHLLRERRKFQDRGRVPWHLTIVGVVVPPVLLASLLATRSRGALLGIAATGGLWLILYGPTLRALERRLLGTGIAALGLGFFLAAGWTPLERVFGPQAEGLDDGGRLAALQTTLEIWSRHPFWGTGLGTFEVAFSQAASTALAGRWRHAHNDWAELLATTGIVGLAFVGIGLILTLRACISGFRRAEGSEERDTCAAAIMALLLAFLHGLFDFGLTLPANAWLLATVVGAALGATSWKHSFTPRSSSSSLPPGSSRSDRFLHREL